MSTLVTLNGTATPTLVMAAGDRAGVRFLEFFASAIRNPHTRRAYARAASEFLTWCAGAGVTSIAAGPSHTAKKGKTPVLDATEARQLLDSIDVTTPIGLRDRALIALMVFSFARVGAALAMRVDDVYVQHRRLWVRLREKGGKRHEIPCHHTLEAYLHAYLDGTGIADDAKGPLFRTIARGTARLSATPLPQANAYAMVRRRALAAGIGTKIGNHTFRATGITAYLNDGGTLENAAAMPNHASTRTTQLYDRRHDDISLDEVERIRV
ncbi:integrase [Paraburkholderia sp. Clong3]|nr:integrase [Paraburkholderia sp. CI2]